MTERLTLKKLSDELETLRAQVLELEQRLEHKIEAALDKAVAGLDSRPEPTNLPKHGISIDTEHRQRLIEQEAYLIAEQRGFQGGNPAEDWARAESQVNHGLSKEGTVGESAMRTNKPATKKPATRKPAAKKPATKAATKPSRRAK